MGQNTFDAETKPFPRKVFFNGDSNGGASIVTESITDAHIQDNSVKEDKIEDGAITLNKINFEDPEKARHKVHSVY